MHDLNGEPYPEPAATASPTLLVVEDEVLLRMLLAEELRAKNYTVIEAASADDALDILLSGTKIDGLVTDVSMPGAMDGLGLVDVVRSLWPAAKIVVASAHAFGVKPGTIDAVFTKPYDLEELLAALEAMLAAGEEEK